MPFRGPMPPRYADMMAPRFFSLFAFNLTLGRINGKIYG